MIGESIHPSPSAGDGRPIEQSRFIKKSDKLERIIQCAQCGMFVDLNKRATGDSLGAIGAPQAKTGTVNPPKPGISFVDNYADVSDTNSGCPFCNSLNPQGRLREKRFGSGINVENL